jgi:hypothetical protein
MITIAAAAAASCTVRQIAHEILQLLSPIVSVDRSLNAIEQLLLGDVLSDSLKSIHHHRDVVGLCFVGSFFVDAPTSHINIVRDLEYDIAMRDRFEAIEDLLHLFGVVGAPICNSTFDRGVVLANTC